MMLNTILLELLNIGGPEMMLILLAILLLFGGKKLPELARGLGKGIREFKDASEGVKREIHRNINAVNDDLSVDLDSRPQTQPQAQTQPLAQTQAQPQNDIQKETEQSHINP